MIKKTVRNKIKIKLLKLNVTQTEFAKYLKVSKQQLNNVINGKVENLILEEKILQELNIK
jgi:transcriptional regulator with XRE-family HTH domain